jgi:hypothetical protein
MEVEELKGAIRELDENIAQGREFEKRGYDCGMMLAISCSLREKFEKQLGELVDSERRPDVL